MSTFPAVTGLGLIKSLLEFGFVVPERKAATAFSSIPMVDVLSFPSTEAKPSAEVSLLRFFETVNSPEKTSRRNAERTSTSTILLTAAQALLPASGEASVRLL